MTSAPGTKTVWHLLSNRWNSAITEYALSTARAFEILGYKSVFSPLKDSPAHKRAESYGLVVRPMAHFGLSALWRVKRLESDLKPSLTMTYGGPEAFLAQLACTRPHAKVVRFRGQDADVTENLFGLKQRWSHHHVSQIITPSAFLAAKIAVVLPELNPQVVPLGCDRNVFHPTGDWTTKPDQPELLVLGRLDPVKGHARIFALFAAMLKIWDVPGVRPFLRVIGQQANLSVKDIEAAATAAGLVWEHDIKLTATRVHSLAGVLSRTTLGVIPSLGSEVICRVAHEFSLCGTPILVSGVGSLEEALFDGAGASYKGLSDEQTVRLLCDLTKHAWEETTDQRRMRSDVARQHYSLDAMAASLQRALHL